MVAQIDATIETKETFQFNNKGCSSIVLIRITLFCSSFLYPSIPSDSYVHKQHCKYGERSVRDKMRVAHVHCLPFEKC